jgi:polysaccharide biosynthesis protein PslG
VNTVGRLRAAGLGYTREAIAWYRVEPTRGNFTWTETDRWVGEAARQGLRVVAILHQPPQWATGSTDRQVAPVEGQPLADYARYVRAVVERYGSTGSFWSQNPLIPKVPITHWNIWNEPYMTFSWHNGGAHAFPDPAGYARMFRAAVVEGRRAGDPAARFMAETEVEAGTTDWSNPRYYLSKMFEAVPDLAQYMDIASIHPYVGTNPARPPSQCATETSDIANRFNFCRIKTIRSILNRHGATETRMWITEMGYSTCPSCTKWKVSEETQAFYVREVFRLLRESRLVDGMIWWVYKTGESDPTHAEDWMGLVRADGSAKPAWNAFSNELKLGL